MTGPALPDQCWPLDPGCLGSEWEAVDDEVQARAAALAIATLRRLTLYRVGGCPITVIRTAVPPCGTAAIPGRGGITYAYGSLFSPGIDLAGRWVDNAGLCINSNNRLDMGGFVGRVDSVVVGDDPPLDLSNIDIEDDRYLVWTGTGTGPFLPTADIEVLYLPAREPDGMAAWCAGTLALQFAKACRNDKSCQLPSNVRTLVRQGVTQTLDVGSFPNGKTGIREVDAWVALYNPAGLRQRPTVWSPDMPELVQRRSAQ